MGLIAGGGGRALIICSSFVREFGRHKAASLGGHQAAPAAAGTRPARDSSMAIRAAVLAESDICHLCGHGGSTDVDHLVPRSVALILGQPGLLTDMANLAPAHGKLPCGICGRRCNQERGTGISKRRPRASRVW